MDNFRICPICGNNTYERDHFQMLERCTFPLCRFEVSDHFMVHMSEKGDLEHFYTYPRRDYIERLTNLIGKAFITAENQKPKE